MAQVTQLSTLYPQVLRWVKGCEPNFILQALQNASLHICKTYDIWLDDLDPQAIIDFQQDYTLTPPSTDPSNTPTSYTAQIHRINDCYVNGNQQVYPMISLVNGNLLRFNPASIPHGQAGRILVCGTAGNLTVSNWQALTNADVGVVVNGTKYNLLAMSFAGLTFPQIALTIQTAIGAAIGLNRAFCRWYTNKFKIWGDETTVSYLVAPTGGTGTNISGSSWMNGLTGGTGVILGSLLNVKAVLRPDILCETLPNWLLDRIMNALIARAIWDLKSSTDQPYFDQVGAEMWNMRFQIEITNICGDVQGRNYMSDGGYVEA